MEPDIVIPTGKTNRFHSPLKILIVEDNPVEADLMALHLKQEGLRIDWRGVESESEYRRALEFPYDLILSDWSLQADPIGNIEDLFSGCL